MAGLPTFNEVWEGLSEEERATASRHVGVNVVDVKTPNGASEVQRERIAWVQVGHRLISCDPDVPFAPPKAPRPSPDRITNAARRIRACDTEQEAIALLDLFARGEEI